MKLTITEIMPLVMKLYEKSCVGCCLHIVLDDGNIEDSHVKFCIEEAKKQGHEDCLELANKLLLMSKTQRHELYKRH